MKFRDIVDCSSNVAEQIHDPAPSPDAVFRWIGVRHSDMSLVPCRPRTYRLLRPQMQDHYTIRLMPVIKTAQVLI